MKLILVANGGLLNSRASHVAKCSSLAPLMPRSNENFISPASQCLSGYHFNRHTGRSNITLPDTMAAPIYNGPPQAVLHTLSNADGSATYTEPGSTYKIIAGVNYPVEVPLRSNEIPESTLIDVNLRPHNGAGMVKERHVEQLVKRTLQCLVLGEETPRTMLQATLQVVGVQSDETLPGGIKGGGQGETYLDILPSAINAAVLGCLDAGVQMRTVAGAALVAIDHNGQLIVHPNVTQRKSSTSLHVFVFTVDGKTVLMESEGNFKPSDWGRAEEVARSAVLGTSDINKSQNNNKQNGDVAMDGSAASESSVICVLDVIRKALHERVIKDERWRQD